MQRRWMARFLVLALILVAIPLATGGPAALQASGTSGSAYAWGYNADGELGNNSTANSSVPVVVSLPTGVTATAIAAGYDHSLAIGSDGKLYAWGYNGSGQLGNNSTTSSTVPVVVSLPTGVTATAIAAGSFHSLAIGSDGTLYAWGANGYGELGNNSTTASSVPVVVSLPTGVTATAIVAGGFHSLASGSDGTLYAWGYNADGELGNNRTTDSSVPVVVSLPTGVTATAIAAGDFHSLASGSDGTLYAWGDNGSGQLGNNSTTDSDVPVVVRLPTGVTATAIAGGQDHSLAILSGRPTAALVAHFRVVHTAHTVVFHWQVASTTGILGFSLTAGARQLNRELIPVHAGSHTYRYASRTSGHSGRYVLHVVLRDGGSIAVAGS